MVEYRIHPDFPNYRVTNTGEVFNKTRSIARYPDKDGYLLCTLRHKGKQRSFRVHRLVAELFCQGFDKKKEVHHIDKSRTNNHADNLLCCSREEHVWIKYGEEIDEIEIWNAGQLVHVACCMGEAVEFTKVDRSVIKEMLEKQLQHHLHCQDYRFSRF